MSKAARKKTPSRVRYEQSHPTITCRVSRETYDNLQNIKQKEGKSFADILKIGLGIVVSNAKRKDEVQKKVYSKGYADGYGKAELEFKVIFSCAVCGKPIPISSQQSRQAAGQYLQEHGWGHAECHQQKQSG